MGNSESSEAEETPSGNIRQASMGDTNIDANEKDASHEKPKSTETDEVPSSKELESTTRDDTNIEINSAEDPPAEDPPGAFADPQENSSASRESIAEMPSESKPEARTKAIDPDSDEADDSQDSSVAPSREISMSAEETDEMQSANKPQASTLDTNDKADVQNGVRSEETDKSSSETKPEAIATDINLNSDEADDAAQDRSYAQTQGRSESTEPRHDLPSEIKSQESSGDTSLDSNHSSDDDVFQECSKEADETPSSSKPDASSRDTNLDIDEENSTVVEALVTDESESEPQADTIDSNMVNASQEQSLVQLQEKSEGGEDTNVIPSMNKPQASIQDTDQDCDKADVNQDTSLTIPQGDSDCSETAVCKLLANTIESDTDLNSDEEDGTQASFVSELQVSSESSKGQNDTGCAAKKVGQLICSYRQRVLIVMVAIVLITGTALGILFGTNNKAAPFDWQPLGPELYGKGALDSFGGTVALSADGTIVAASGMGKDKTDAGHVSIYSYDPIRSSWDLMGQELFGLAKGDWFGDSLALSANGTIVAAGAPYHDKNGDASGQVRVHEYDPVANRWNPIGQVLNGKANHDFFGSSVALSADGTVLAVSAPTNDAAARDAGCVYVYSLNRSSNIWELLGQQLNGAGVSDGFGEFLALSSNGKNLVVSAPYHDDGGDPKYRGRVQVYQYDTSSNGWNQLGQNLDGKEAYERFGRSVAMSADGTRVAAARSWTHYDPTHPGRVSVYEFDHISNLWSPVGQELYGEAAGDVFGEAMALSSDGSILAVGAKGNDDNGKCSGNIRLFKYDKNTDRWNNLGQALGGQAAGDFFGQALDLSADGSIVAVGAASNSGNGQDAGLVRVFTSQ